MAASSWRKPTLREIRTALEKEIPDDAYLIGDQDPDTGLVMLKRTEVELPLDLETKVRGSIWCFHQGKAQLVIPSLGVIPEISCRQIVEDGDQYKIGRHLFDLTDARFLVYTEGLFVRIYKFRGKTYFSSYNKLDISLSRWGKMGYLEAYRQAGGIPADQIFGSAPDYREVYCLMITVPQVVTGSQQNIPGDRGYLTLVRTVDNCLSDRINPNGTKFPETTSIESLEQANQFLKTGYYPEADQLTNPLMLPGEAITLSYQDEIYKLVPQSHNWRNMLRGGDSSPRHRLFYLLAQLNLDIPLIPFREIPIIELTSIVKQGVVPLPLPLRDDDKKASDLKYLIFLNYLYSLPSYLHCEAIDWYQQFLNAKKKAGYQIALTFLGKLQYLDPSELKIVPFDDDKAIIQLGDRGITYDVSQVKVDYGKYLILLKEPHYLIKEIVHYLSRMRGRYSFSFLFQKSLQRLFSAEPSKIVQVLRQAQALSPKALAKKEEPQEPEKEKVSFSEIRFVEERNDKPRVRRKNRSKKAPTGQIAYLGPED